MMGENSKIEWTHHTFNPWWGCYKISPGCDHCYAAALDRRLGLEHWGTKGPRRFFPDKHWAQPLKWDRHAALAGERQRVFAASMADVFEDREDLAEHRARLFGLIQKTPNLDWLLLTKRPENAARLWFAAQFQQFNGADSLGPTWAPNVWLGTTVEDQARADTRIGHLLNTPARVRFLSCEPLLEPVDLTSVTLAGRPWRVDTLRIQGEPPGFGLVERIGMPMPKIDWVICGGESGGRARPMNPEWARSIRDQCSAAGVPFHFKQWGQKGAGRELDGRHWDGLPRPNTGAE